MILGDLVRRASPSLSGAATAVVSAAAPPASHEPTPAGPNDRTRTRGANEALATEQVAPRVEAPETSDRATTRTALAPDVVAALALETSRTIPEQASPAQSDPSLRPSRGGGPVTLPASRAPLYVGAVLAICVLGGLALLALRLLG